MKINTGDGTHHNIVGTMTYKKGKDHHNWKGDKVGIGALHEWVIRQLPKPDLCKCLERPPKDLSNNGIYDRNLDNWEWLCRSCHLKKDGRDHKGEKNGAAKLNKIQVIEIRKKYKGNWGEFTKLAEEYGVSYWTISQIIKRKIWKHV